MKQIRYPLFCYASIFLAALMLFFTFFAWGWFSDARGVEAYFEIPVSTDKGPLATTADLLWMASPFFLLIALFFSLFPKKRKSLSLSLSLFATLPLGLYSILELISIMDGEKVHGSVVTTLVFLLLFAVFCPTAAKNPSLQTLTAQLFLIHAALETALLFLSFLLEQKLSQFYFSQLLPIGTLSTFHYRFFIISVFLFYLFFSLSLGLRPLAGEPPEKKEKTPQREEEEPAVEEENLDFSSISLEDLGIEK